jgi:PAS domain S-box-containing protein
MDRMPGQALRAQAGSASRGGIPRLWLVLGFCLALLILLGISVEAYRESQRAEATRVAVTHTMLVLKQALELENAATLMESRHRAYLVQGDPEFLRRRESSYADVLSMCDQLARLVSDNPAQVARTREVRAQLLARHQIMQQISDTVLSQGIAVARANFHPYGPASSDPIRSRLTQFRAVEEQLLAARSRIANRDSDRLDLLLVYGTATGFLIIAAAALVLLRQLDRSERIGQELTRANAEARHALDLVDATHDGVLIYAADTLRISYANRGMIEQVGYSRDELRAMTVLDIKREFDERGFRELIAPLLAGDKKAMAFETRHRRKDGSEVPVEVSLRYAVVVDGPPALVTVARDISARKQAEDERDRFFTLSLDMLCIASPDGYFKRVSPAFTKTLGWSVEEMLARPFLDFVHPDDHAATLAEVARQIVAGEPVMQFENRYRHKDGSWRVLSWKSAPQPDGFMYATARDVTENKAAEQRIVDLNRELTERQVALEAANKELESFSYSVSHDLRAPLRHINGYARMLVEDIGPSLAAESHRYLQAIIASAQRMGLLIDDLLNLARLGRKSLSQQSVDMTELVRSALAELVVGNPDSAAAAARVFVATLPVATGDSALLKQVWVNLLSNAFKYSAPRGTEARIVVSGERRDDALRYCVNDNGVGFDMRYADKLFGVFQRLHAQDQFEGTGVGLAIVHRVISRHGGRVSATGELDRGATFCFELPIIEVSE